MQSGEKKEDQGVPASPSLASPPGLSPASGSSQSGIANAGGPDRIAEFETALFAIPWVAERVAAGQQFNAYESANNEPDDEPDDWEYVLCLGPVGNQRFICRIVGQDRAALVEAGMKLATVALQQRIASSRVAWDIEQDAKNAARAAGLQPLTAPEPRNG